MLQETHTLHNTPISFEQQCYRRYDIN